MGPARHRRRHPRRRHGPAHQLDIELPLESVRRQLCVGVVTPVIVRDGVVLNVGRTPGWPLVDNDERRRSCTRPAPSPGARRRSTTANHTSPTHHPRPAPADPAARPPARGTEARMTAAGRRPKDSGTEAQAPACSRPACSRRPGCRRARSKPDEVSKESSAIDGDVSDRDGAIRRPGVRRSTQRGVRRCDT